jgi:hypothetical protein
MNMSDDDERAIAIESLSNTQLIQILQLDDSDENEPNSIRRMVEAEIARRRKEGGATNDGDVDDVNSTHRPLLGCQRHHLFHSTWPEG